MSLFITFEGIEGCGKSYQSRKLLGRLTREGIKAILTFEPGGTQLGNNIRNILKRQLEFKITAETELFLFSACRAQLIKDVISPAIHEDKIVICDRYIDSTVAYQGFGRGLDIKLIETVNKLSSAGILPDLTILLDLPVEEGLRRKINKTGDRFDSESLDFHSRVRNGFLYLADKDPQRWWVVNGLLSRSQISLIVWEKITSVLIQSKERPCLR
jgi:dTMP kinase